MTEQDKGMGLFEYALIAGLVAVGVVVFLTYLGEKFYPKEYQSSQEEIYAPTANVRSVR